MLLVTEEHTVSRHVHTFARNVLSWAKSRMVYNKAWFTPTGIIVHKPVSLTHLGVMGAHGSRAALGAPGVALLWVRICVVLHLIIPGLHMVSRWAVPIRHRINRNGNTVHSVCSECLIGMHLHFLRMLSHNAHYSVYEMCDLSIREALLFVWELCTCPSVLPDSVQ